MFLHADIAATPQHAWRGDAEGPVIMRSFALAAALLLITPAPAQARLFWQTYGATVATESGCAWNLNQDYFVPRHCETGRYGLFSACKTADAISAACKNLHPVYSGYCTPYGPCRYKWRDHVYKTHCGCMPLKYHHGPWDRCHKHPLFPRHAGRGCSTCGLATVASDGPAAGYETIAVMPRDACLCHVEPFGGETLGSISAVAAGSGGAAGTVGRTPAPTAQPLPPKLNLTPAAATSGGLPAPFNY